VNPVSHPNHVAAWARGFGLRARLVLLVIAAINIDPPSVLFGIFVAYGFSGYALYGWRKAKGQQTSVISTSKDEPDERGLHK